jgi:hypothetical protein
MSEEIRGPAKLQEIIAADVKKTSRARCRSNRWRDLMPSRAPSTQWSIHTHSGQGRCRSAGLGQPAHGDDRRTAFTIDEAASGPRISLVSRPKKAAAHFTISRSIGRDRVSRRSLVSSSVVRFGLAPWSTSAWMTPHRSDSLEIPRSIATDRLEWPAGDRGGSPQAEHGPACQLGVFGMWTPSAALDSPNCRASTKPGKVPAQRNGALVALFMGRRCRRLRVRGPRVGERRGRPSPLLYCRPLDLGDDGCRASAAPALEQAPHAGLRAGMPAERPAFTTRSADGPWRGLRAAGARPRRWGRASARRTNDSGSPGGQPRR